MSRPRSTPKETQAVVAERRANAVKLRIAGYSCAEIAEKLGYGGSTPESAADNVSKDISRALKARLAEQGRAADQLRELQIARVEKDLTRTNTLIRENRHDPDMIAKLIDRRIKLYRELARIQGLDAPVRIDTNAGAMVVSQVIAPNDAGDYEAASQAGVGAARAAADKANAETAVVNQIIGVPDEPDLT